MTCVTCKYYRGGVSCAAFPTGIPEAILTGAVRHDTHYPGDQGVCYEASGTTAGVSAFHMHNASLTRPLDPIELPVSTPRHSWGQIPNNVIAGFLFLLFSLVGVAIDTRHNGLSPLVILYLLFATFTTINMVRQQWWAWFVIMLIVFISMGFSVVGLVMLHARILLVPLALGSIQLYLLFTDPP